MPKGIPGSRPGDPIPTDAERFWAKVDKSAGPDGCWLWTALPPTSRYGQFTYSTRPSLMTVRPPWARTRVSVVAHKWAWEDENGPVPPGKVLDHFRCDNPPCVNPAHLRPVTEQENILRASGFASANAAKTHCPQGHPYDKTNTYVNNGGRTCRACNRRASLTWLRNHRASQKGTPSNG